MGHQQLLAEYREVENNLIAAEDQMDRGSWILGVDSYNDHVNDLRLEADSFPANLAIQIFGLKLPEIIAR